LNEGKEKQIRKYTAANKPSASMAGGFRMVAFTKPVNDNGKEKKQQVNPELRLLAGR
jgi:hypothetical protein